MASQVELLNQAIAIGEELVRVCDLAGLPLAAVHVETGLDIMRAHAARAELVGRAAQP
ncbi:hypothetical protein [Sphingomonas sp.]|uniref:hypothetical protein n=1 Tax=Sphingomonas sp. TaxID=28214 RepID=UPI001B103D13|nr:hypothetical protein [Sphingomonas sp.]MBO9712903.1 hypothetical protein [Sphingomonas sp.]